MKRGQRPSPETLTRAMKMYFDGATGSEIAKVCNVTAITVGKWAMLYGWSEQKKELIRKGQRTVVERYAQFQEANLDAVMKRQLELTQGIDKHVRTHLDKPMIPPKDLADVARAAASSAGISSNLVGLTRLNEEKSKPSLVQVGIQVKLADPSASDSAKPIEAVVSAPQDPWHAAPGDPF